MNKYLKNKKALLCLMLVVAVMASIFVVMAMPAGAESVLESLDGATFSSTKYYTMQSPIAEHGSYTLEAEFYIDPTTADKDRVGNIIGNWHDDSTKRSGNEWTIELHYYGAVRLYHASGKSAFFHQGTDHTAAADAKNDGSVTDIRTYMTDENGNPAYVKITITVDTTTGDASLYVNGNCVKTITGSAAFKDRVYSVSAKNPNHIIGNDHRVSKSASTFKGSIRNVAMYSYVRDVENTIYGEAFTATEKDPNLLFAYDLTELKVNGGYVNDYSSNGIKAVNTNWKIDNDSTGRTFTGNDSLFLSKELDVMPQTFEAVVYAPKSVSRPGVIFGNYHGGEAAINFELHSSGNATIHLDPSSASGVGAYATKIADVRNDYGWVHITIVRVADSTNGAMYNLYVDGRLVTSMRQASDKTELDMEAIQEFYKFSLGRDSRGDNAQYFKGRIKNVALYSEALTSEEVFSSYKNGVGTGSESLILNYDMTTIESTQYVKDTSGNGYHMTNGGVPLESFMMGRGFDSDDEFYLEKAFTEQPMTYEALLLAPSAVSRPGVVFGNYTGSASCINFEIYSNGNPSIYLTDSNGNTMSTKFTKVDVRTDELVHVVITHEIKENGAVFNCYINGELKDTIETTEKYIIDMVAAQNSTAFSLGRDSRGDNAQYFKGRIKNVALYSEVLTEAEIKASYENGINSAKSSLMAHYELDGTDGANVLEDETGNGYALHSIFYPNLNPAKDYAYSFAVVGDTQKLVYQDAYNGTDYTSYIYDWIVANKDSKNIKFVMGMGDITDKNGKDNTSDDGVDQTDIEWNIAVAQHEKLTNANIPYGIIQGNHDTVAKLDEYFAGNANYTNPNVTVGYYSGNSLGDYYMDFFVGDTEYMMIGLHYGAEDAVLNWAGGVIASHPNARVIITTHAYMYRDGTTLDINDVVPPRKATDKESSAGASRNNGDQMWTKLASQYPNVIMVLSGHDPCANVVMRQDTGVYGNTVTQMLIDYQGMDTTYKYKTGMVAMLYFSADGKEVQVEYISTYQTAENNDGKDYIYNAGKNAFSFTIPDAVAPVAVECEYGTIDAQYANAVTYPFVVFDSNRTFLGGYGDLGAAATAAKKAGLSGDYTILMRRDAEQNTKSYELAHMIGSLTIDLGGYTLYKTAVGYIFDIYVTGNALGDNASLDMRGTYSIKNGTIEKHGTLPIACVNYGETLARNYKVAFNFDNITFVNKTEGNNNILAAWENGYSKVDKCAYADIVFNDCTFDYLNSSDGTQMIYLTNENGYDRTIYNVTINGGKIVSATAVDFSTFVKADGNLNGRADKVTFGKGKDGEYLTMVLPASASAPNIDLRWESSDGSSFILVAKEFGNANTTYVFEDLQNPVYGQMTDFGYIANAYYENAENKPILLIENGKVIGTYKYFSYDKDAESAISAVKNLTDGSDDSEKGRVLQMLLVGDAELKSNFSNFGQILGTLIVNLNGHTIYQTGGSSFLFSQAKNWKGVDDATFKLYNGNILINSPLLTFSAYGATYQSAEGYKTFHISFENVNISYVEGSTATSFLGVYTESGTGGPVTGKEVGYDVKFTDCTFDFTNASSMQTFMNANDPIISSDGTSLAVNSIVNVKVVGGEIITNNPELVLADVHATNGSSVTFEKGENGYTTMILPLGTSAPTGVANGGTLSLVKISEKEGTATYILSEIDANSYVPMMSITLDSELIANIYIPVSGTQKFTLDGKIYENLTAADLEVVTLEDGSYYRVSLKLPAKFAAKELALLVDVKFGETEASGTFTFSIPKYAAKVLADGNDVEKTLVKDVLAYIKSAYVYFGTGSTDAIDTLLEKYEYESIFEKVEGTVDAAEGLKGATFVLEATPAVRFYLPIGANVNDYSFKQGGTVLPILGTGTETIGNEEATYIDVSLYAYRMIKGIDYYVGGTKTGTYHINDYYDYVSGEGYTAANKEKLVDLVEKFYTYCKSAQAYKIEVTK